MNYSSFIDSRLLFDDILFFNRFSISNNDFVIKRFVIKETRSKKDDEVNIVNMMFNFDFDASELTIF